MRIASLESQLLRVPLGAARGGSGATHLQLLHVTARADDGLEGTGFTYSLTGGAEAAGTTVRDVFTDQVVGTDPIDWDRLWRTLWSQTHRVGRGVALPALSAVDIAVWDLRARAAGLPLFRFLGAHHDTVEMYGSGRATHGMSLDELIEGTRAYLDEGYRAVKLRAGALGVEEDRKRVAAVRGEFGDALRLMVDCNERFELATAQWFSHRLADLEVYWLEEPIASDDVAGHATLARRSPIPIAAGEHLQGRFEFSEYLRQGAATVLQPDAPLMGGVSEWMRVATLAEAHSVAVSPHFLPELHVHLAAAAPAATYVEHFPLIDDVLEETLVVRDGRVTPPDRPGHGMRWDAKAIAHFAVR